MELATRRAGPNGAREHARRVIAENNVTEYVLPASDVDDWVLGVGRGSI